MADNKTLWTWGNQQKYHTEIKEELDKKTVYTHPTTSGNKHIPSGGSSGQILRWASDGIAYWGNDVDTTYSTFVGSGVNAKSGLVPQPPTTEGTTKYLREDGTWATPSYTTNTDTKVTSVGNHYTPAKSTTKSASGGTLTDITNSTSGTQVVTGVEMDAKGHVTGVVSASLKSTAVDEVKISESEPTDDSVKIWINPAPNTTYSLPQINNNEISDDDTWSSSYIMSNACSNANLLINPDFQINQRKVTICSTPFTYTCDRWMFSVADTDDLGEFNATSGYLRSNLREDGSNSRYAAIKQYLDNPKKYAGKTMTLSVEFSEVSNNCMIQVLREEGLVIQSIAYSKYNSDLRRSLTFSMPTNLTDTEKVSVVVQTTGSCMIRYVKLEYGNYATAFISPDPTLELIKCQRYYLPIGRYTRYPMTRYDSDSIDFIIPIPTQMRKTEFSGNLPKIIGTMKVLSETKSYTDFTISIADILSPNAITIRATKSSHGLTSACLDTNDATNNGVIFDAEIHSAKEV